ncbi:hypothetical protein F5X96DRAFT_624913 [Biscogniauxia mediterranea]|nr:hypothetical protein F5X96DRAFT_624913 [Biscogniauxia mediterranea]
MCHITRLFCVVCHTGGTYLFTFCENVRENKYFGKVAPTGERIYCPEFVWPPELLIRSQHICDNCLKKGVEWYARARQRAEMEQAARKAYEIVENPFPSDQVESEDVNSEDDSDASETDQASLHLVRDGFHESWDNINPRIKLLVVNTFNSIKPDEFDLYWKSRTDDASFRTLRLYIPFCKICKTASLNIEGGVDGVEMEPEPILWKWMSKARNECAIETHLSTDFMMKPCTRCANNEIKLRHQVYNFLKSCSNQQAWALWRCLQLRGRGGADFWRLKDMDTLGHPDTRPKDYRAYLRLMGEGWEDKAGSAWENFVDIPFAPTYQFPVVHFPETFLSLDQWKRFGNLGVLDMTNMEVGVKSRAPELLTEEFPENKNLDSSVKNTRDALRDLPISEIGPNGVKYRSIPSPESSQTIAESDNTWDEVDSPANKQKNTGTKKNNGSKIPTETSNGIMQEDDDVSGDRKMGGYDDLAVQYPKKATPTNGHRISPSPNGDNQTSDVEMGDASAAPTKRKTAQVKRKNGSRAGSAVVKPKPKPKPKSKPKTRAKKRVHFT